MQVSFFLSRLIACHLVLACITHSCPSSLSLSIYRKVQCLFIFFSTPRLDEESTARDALLVAEKQENEVTKKALTEALDQIEELVKEIERANNSIHQLQDSIQRSVYSKASIHETSS